MVIREIVRSSRVQWKWLLFLVIWLASLSLTTSSTSDRIETPSTQRGYLRGFDEESRRLQETTTTITTYSLDLDKIDAPGRHRKSVVTKRTVKKKIAPALQPTKGNIQTTRKENQNPVDEGRQSEVTTENRGQRQRRRRQCRQLRRVHQVVPGRSWGNMTKQQQDQWLSLQCDDFFCEPHELAGKGIYKCIPLPADATQQEDVEPAANEYLADPPPPGQQQ